MISHRKRRIVLTFFWGLYFLLHLLGAIYMAHTHTDFFLHDDGDEYLQLSQSFAGHGNFISPAARYYEAPRTQPMPEAFRTLLLSLCAGILIKIFHDPLTGAAIFQALVAVLLAGSIWRIGRRINGERCAWTALALFTLHPLILVFSFRFSSELFFLLFLSLFIQSWLEAPAHWKYPLMALCGGLATAVRPTAMLLLPAVAVFLGIRLIFRKMFPDAPLSLRSGLRQYAVYAGVFLLVLSPWCFRSYHYFDTLSPTGFLGGFNLFVGNNRDNAAAYRAGTGAEFKRLQTLGWDRAIALAKSMPENMPPKLQQKWFQQKTMEELNTMSAGEICAMIGAKAWHFVRPWPMHGLHSPFQFWGITLYELLLTFSAAAGIFLLRKRPAFLLFLLMIVSVGWSAHSLIHLQMRHRVPFLDLSMILLGSYAFSVWLEKLRQTAARYRGASADSSGRSKASEDIPGSPAR